MLDSPTHSDGDLLRLMRAGDEQAFTALYRRHQGPVFRFALQMGGSAEMAEEVTQEVFMIVMRDSKQYDPNRGSLSAYLFGIARNLVLRFLERERPYIVSSGEAESDRLGSVPDAQDVFGELHRNQEIESLRKAVLALPPNYREVVVLCDLHEMDYAEAAAVMGCAVGTVRSRLHRARALLMEKMRAADRCPA